MATPKFTSIWTPAFAMLCLAQFLGYAQHSMLTPTFPLWVTELGASPFVVGLVIASFAATSVVLRPLIGYWADRWNEAGVLVSGMFLLAASVLICYIPIVGATMLANGLRGIGWAGMNTGGYSLLAMSAPVERRGEASGYYSGVQGSATILFPAVALWLIDAPFGGFRVVFAAAVGLALAGAGIGMLLARCAPPPVREARAEAHRLDAPTFALLERDVLLPSTLLFFLNLTLPTVSSFMVLYAQTIGIANFGWYFVVSGATSLLARPLLGRASDQIGRGHSLAAAFALQMAALILVLAASNLSGLMVSGALYMLGNALGSATTLALAVERANPERRGRSMATFSVAYPLSNGVGALLIGGAIEIAGYSWMFVLVAALAASGLALTFAAWAKLR